MPGYKIISFPQCWNLGLFSRCERAEFLTAVCSAILSASQEKQWFTQNRQEQSLAWNQEVPSQLRDSQIPGFLKCCLGGSLWDCEAMYVSVQQNTIYQELLGNKRRRYWMLQSVPLGLPHVQWLLEMLLVMPWSAGFKNTTRGKLGRQHRKSQLCFSGNVMQSKRGEEQPDGCCDQFWSRVSSNLWFALLGPLWRSPPVCEWNQLSRLTPRHAGELLVCGCMLLPGSEEEPLATGRWPMCLVHEIKLINISCFPAYQPGFPTPSRTNGPLSCGFWWIQIFLFCRSSFFILWDVPLSTKEEIQQSRWAHSQQTSLNFTFLKDSSNWDCLWLCNKFTLFFHCFVSLKSTAHEAEYQHSACSGAVCPLNKS